MPAGIEEFVAARGVALIRFAYLLCGDRFLAEDLVQAVMERCVDGWIRHGMPGYPEAYVKKAITNEFVSFRRRAWTRDVVVAHPPTATVADDTATAADRDELWQALAGLPSPYRAVLVLRYYEDLDDASIADILGCARATVRSTARRALAQLRVHPVISGKAT